MQALMPSKAEDREVADMLVEVVRAKGVVEELVLGITHPKSGRV